MGLTAKRRAKLIKKFINVAEWCRKNGNFNTAMEIVSALAKTPVVRLKLTWKELSESVLKKYGPLRELLAPTTNYGTLRKLQTESIQKPNTPTIPYFGILLQDLLAVEEIETKTKSNLINFKKLRRLAYSFKYFRDRQADVCNSLSLFFPHLLGPAPSYSAFSLSFFFPPISSLSCPFSPSS